jgi:hypothetical protein
VPVAILAPVRILRPTLAELQATAIGGQFIFEVDLHDTPSNSPYLVSGTGVADLNRMLLLMNRMPPPRVRLDIGLAFFVAEQSMILVLEEDIWTLRALFIAKWGYVNKIDEFGVGHTTPSGLEQP